jgi:hypothetical protein
MKSADNRNKLFVNRLVQGKAISYVFFYWAGYHLILGIVMFFFRLCQYFADYMAGGPLRNFDDLYSDFVRAQVPMLVCGLFVLPILMWDVLKSTHRCVGPLVRLKESLARLTRGEPVSEIKFRKGDMLVDLLDAFNQFLRSPYYRGQPTERSPATIGEAAAQQPSMIYDANAVIAEKADLRPEAAPIVSTARSTTSASSITRSMNGKW